MGSWGYGPFENDDGLGIICEVMNNPERILFRKRFSESYGDYEKTRAVIGIMIAIRKFTDFRIGTEYEDSEKNWIQIAIEKLTIILNDEGYVENWDDPSDIKKDIRRQIRILKKL